MSANINEKLQKYYSKHACEKLDEHIHEKYTTSVKRVTVEKTIIKETIKETQVIEIKE